MTSCYWRTSSHVSQKSNRVIGFVFPNFRKDYWTMKLMNPGLRSFVLCYSLGYLVSGADDVEHRDRKPPIRLLQCIEHSSIV